MLVARELLNLIRSMVEEFSGWGRRDAVPESTVQAQYIAIVCMLRSVGHVLEKVDCTNPAEKRLLQQRWTEWKKEPIFATFIEPSRNELLKEFKNKVNLNSEDVSRRYFGGTDTVSVHFDAAKLKDLNGRFILPLFWNSITFWDNRLGEIEARQELGRQS